MVRENHLSLMVFLNLPLFLASEMKSFIFPHLKNATPMGSFLKLCFVFPVDSSFPCWFVPL